MRQSLQGYVIFLEIHPLELVDGGELQAVVARHPHAVLSLRHVIRLDQRAVAVLLRAQSVARARGGDLRLCDAGRLAEHLRSIRLDTALRVFDTHLEALGSFGV
jgi:anti-anti-sigma regulatory factor